ncbi:hypothetical protein OA93_11770 [Flavobacterium sp. KMS]|uniref:hypothetical protein n=1 Tax=Flavobacterium sp. KMS TaxID=1566023 RepID=UPI00058002AF|nr:hypothetical protein [Flavobacterium sp. KMS]KIA97672.1 hypothetical protein OA93_11770 [Flavobacterium sp. KMS]
MKLELQKFRMPIDCKIIENKFYTYDPELEYAEENNLFYLCEDLLQIKLERLDLIVDLGWYGNVSKNNGIFKIYIIKNENWEHPVKIEASKSQKEITRKLEEILFEITELQA